MKIVITGGAGYLGSILTPELLKLGHEVTVVDAFIFRQTSLSECCGYESFSVIRGDCRQEKLMRQITAEADLVIPLAALVGAPLCNRDESGAISTNQGAVEMLCQILRPEQKIIYPTTNSGYGIGEKGKFCTEETPLNPISLYGVTKVRAEEAVLKRGNSLTFRLATVFGMSPRMRLDLLVNDFVYRAVHDRAILIFEGHFQRNYIHVRDVARVFIHAIHHFEAMKGRSYNVGLEDANLSKLELCARDQEATSRNSFTWRPPSARTRTSEITSFRTSASCKTGFQPEWSLDAGHSRAHQGRWFTILRNSAYANV